MGDPLGGGKFLFALTVIGVVIVVGMLAFPNVSTMLRSVDTTGWLPLTASAMTFLPYAFWGFIIYIALSVWKVGSK